MNFISKVLNHARWLTLNTLRITIPQYYLSFYMPKIIMSGPFKGMKYINRSTGSPILCKLAGTYEDELYETLEYVKTKKYSQFIDIGAAEGYYVVGISKYILPDLKERVAFEYDHKGQNRIKELCKLNDCPNVIIKGFCDENALLETISNEQSFLIVDIEGGEFDLLGSRKINFNKADILVEIHETEPFEKMKILKEKFASTHKITQIDAKVKKLPEDVNWHPKIKKHGDYIVDEFRYYRTWLFMESNIK